MVLETVMLNEAREEDKYHMISLIAESKITVQMNLLTRQKLSHRFRKQIYGNKGERSGG